ncbi:hypothetical protein MYIN104542_30035 [Mycobacterium intermedium]
MVGQYEPILVGLGANQQSTECTAAHEVTYRGPLRGAQRRDLLIRIAITCDQVDIAPRHDGIDREDLHRLGEPIAEPGQQVRMSGANLLHRSTKPVHIQRAGNGDAHLHRIQFLVTLSCGGVEQQPLLQRCQRQDVGDPILLLQFIDLRLVQSGWCDVRWAQPAPTLAHMCADPAQRLKPQPAQPLDAVLIQNRSRITPACLQPWAAPGVHGCGVEFHTVRQRHWYGGRGTGDLRHALRA